MKRGPGLWTPFWSIFTSTTSKDKYQRLLLGVWSNSFLSHLCRRQRSHNIQHILICWFQEKPKISMFLLEGNVFIQGPIKNKPATNKYFMLCKKKKRFLDEYVKSAFPSKLLFWLTLKLNLNVSKCARFLFAFKWTDVFQSMVLFITRYRNYKLYLEQWSTHLSTSWILAQPI